MLSRLLLKKGPSRPGSGLSRRICDEEKGGERRDVCDVCVPQEGGEENGVSDNNGYVRPGMGGRERGTPALDKVGSEPIWTMPSMPRRRMGPRRGTKVGVIGRNGLGKKEDG